MSAADVALWQVYKVPIPSATGRDERPHFHIVVYADYANDDYRGLVITTNIPKFAQRRPQLRPCFISLTPDQLDFLSYPSWLNANKAEKLSRAVLSSASFVGVVPQAVRTHINHDLDSCRVLTPKIKMAMFETA
ncbi:MAG: hypothetical protein U5L04_10415 [Trueperaceae bacterium]|nr:hypothetical protein [Trueperaceae bacterium]